MTKKLTWHEGQLVRLNTPIEIDAVTKLFHMQGSGVKMNLKYKDMLSFISEKISKCTKITKNTFKNILRQK